MDSLLHLMKKNRGNRRFSDKPISKELVNKILEAGSAAPAGPVDGIHIFVIDKKEKRQDIHRICVDTEQKWMTMQPISVQERIVQGPDYDPNLSFLIDAPLLLAVSTRPRDPELPYAVESAFMAIGYMLVMTKGIGLIATPYAPSVFHHIEVNYLNEILKLPPGETVQALLPIGYPEAPQDTVRKWSGRNVFLNEYGVRFFQDPKSDQRENAN